MAPIPIKEHCYMTLMMIIPGAATFTAFKACESLSEPKQMAIGFTVGVLATIGVYVWEYKRKKGNN